MIKVLISGLWRFAFFLLIVTLIVAGTEAFGLSLLLPLFSALVDPSDKLGDVTKYVDMFLKNPDPTNRIFVLLFALIILFFVKSVFLIIHNGMSAYFAMKLRERWSNKILATYMGSEFKYIMNEKQGVMLHNTLIEPFRVSKSMIDLLQLLSKLIMATAIFIMLLFVSYKITMAISAFGIIIILAIKNSTYKYSLKFGKRRLKVSQEASDITSESINAIKEIKMLGKEKWYQAKLMDRLKEFTKIHTFFSIFSNLPENLLELFFIILITIGISVITASPHLEIHDVISLLGFYIVVGQKLFKYVTLIISQRMKITSALPSLKLIHNLITTKKLKQESVEKGVIFNKLHNDIMFKDVSFSYNSTRPVLRNFNLTIAKNKMTALVGPSGSGKSTIADILMRILTPESGQIRINDNELHQFNLSSWREKIGYVSQDPFLFNMSIKDNILMGKIDASERELQNACQIANIYDFIVSLKDGYGTIVGDRGIKLSGGQKQRIVIARAVIRNPEIFVFDEATSALDAESEAQVQESINNLVGNSTILVIAHRLSTIEKADYVFDLSKMKIAV